MTTGGLVFRAVIFIVIVNVMCLASVSAQDAKLKGEKVYTDQKCSVCHSVGGMVRERSRAGLPTAQPACDGVQGATASMTFSAILAMWNL